MMHHRSRTGAWIGAGLAVAGAAIGAGFPVVDEYIQLAGQMESALTTADTNAVVNGYTDLRAKHLEVQAAFDGARYQVEAAYQEPLEGAGGTDDPYIAAIRVAKISDLDRSLSMLAIKDYQLLRAPPTREVAIRTLTNGVASTVNADAALTAALSLLAGRELPPRVVVDAAGPATASPGEAIRIDCTLRNVGDRTASNLTLRVETTWSRAVQVVPLPSLPGQQETFHAVYLALPPIPGAVGAVVSAGASNTGGTHARVDIRVE